MNIFYWKLHKRDISLESYHKKVLSKYKYKITRLAVPAPLNNDFKTGIEIILE